MQTLPLHFDLYALVILLGIAQALFLGVFFLTGPRRQSVANLCLGLLMLATAAMQTEMWLEYTNYMFRTLPLVDSAEPFNFVIGPLFYFFVFGRLHSRLPRHWGWHLIPFGIWLVNAVTWLYQPESFFYNSYISAWHPELDFVTSNPYQPDDFTGLRDYINELTLLSCLVYSALSVRVVYRGYQTRYGSVGSPNADRSLRTLRSLVVLNGLFPLLIVITKTRFPEDLGDHILASYLTLIIYVTSFLVMRGSDFFRDSQAFMAPVPVSEPPGPAPEPSVETRKKYEKSALTDEQKQAILARLTHLTQTQKPYLDNDLSLSKLAERLGTSPHYVSQVLNDQLGQTFFDWLATHRIAEAQRLLNHPDTSHLKIDEIAERVGYNAPSAFHTAFKRITGQTPASFRSARTSS